MSRTFLNLVMWCWRHWNYAVHQQR